MNTRLKVLLGFRKKMRLHYLYHGRKESSLNQTQQGINDLQHGHHLTEIHHVGRSVEGIVERICGGRERQTRHN